MGERLTKLTIKNFRSLANVTIEPRSVNILFGPNGAGKSTFLDTLWFLRDCMIRGVDTASSARSHGIGALWDGAEEGEGISIALETDGATYQVDFGYSSGRIEPFPGETLRSRRTDRTLIDRKIGSDTAVFYHSKMDQVFDTHLRDLEQLSLGRFLDFDPEAREGREMSQVLHCINFHHCRHFPLYRLKMRGSDSSHHVRLREGGKNLWSVLRNLNDKRDVDGRYNAIMDHMKLAFPAFVGIVLEQTGPGSVYCDFIEQHHEHQIHASGMSEGLLQFLILLTALFSEGPNSGSIILFDEPDISLHPHALAVFAEAVNLAARDWGKQVFIATHSPVLISQFETEDILAVEQLPEIGTSLQWVNEIEGIQDLLEQYATGSLYMAQQIAPQQPMAEARNE